MTNQSQQLRDLRQPGWFWGPNELIDVSGAKLGAYGIAVYCVLAKMAGQKSTAWPSIRYIANLIGCSEGKVRESLKKLAELGWIRVEQRRMKTPDGNKRNLSNVYYLLETPPSSTGGTSQGEGGTSPGEGGTSQGTGGTSPGEGGTSPGEGEKDSLEKDSGKKNPQPSPNGTKPKPKTQPVDPDLDPWYTYARYAHHLTYDIARSTSSHATKLAAWISSAVNSMKRLYLENMGRELTGDDMRRFCIWCQRDSLLVPKDVKKVESAFLAWLSEIKPSVTADDAPTSPLPFVADKLEELPAALDGEKRDEALRKLEEARNEIIRSKSEQDHD